MKELSDDKIIESWRKNAAPWILAIQEEQIQSRLLVTNQAIIDTITQLKPGSVLDIGCGEGWLVRELCHKGIDALGVDVVAELINHANQSGPGRFQTLSYAQLARHELGESFDLVVCNFSLLGKESVDTLFKSIPSILNANGHFVVQTLHPVSACGDAEYKDGWREGSWEGFNKQFRDPAPWYFRTLETWQELFTKNGFSLKQSLEPIHPQTGTAASIIMVGQSRS